MKLPTETVVTCPCGSVESSLLREFVFWSPMALRRCDACGLLLTSPRLTKESMHFVFSRHYFDTSTLEQWGKRRKRVFRDVVRILERHGSESVFDVGAAFGHFVRYAQRAGLAASGSDLSDDAVRVAREQLGVELQAGCIEDLEIPSHSFDAVVSLDTFYYAADPRAELSAIRRVLRPGGMLVLRLRNCWSTDIPYQHLWGFTPASAANLLKREGWTVEEMLPASYSDSVLRPFHVALVWLNGALRKISRRVPIMTHSFTVVATPP